MKKLLSIITVALINSINSSSFAMQPEEQEVSCWNSLISYRDKNQQQPLLITKPVKNTLEVYHNIVITQMDALIKKTRYGELIDLVTTVHQAKKRHSIPAAVLGKFIFEQNKTKNLSAQASLVVYRIGNYLQEIKTVKSPRLTRIAYTVATEINPKTKDLDERAIIYQLHLFNVYKSENTINPSQKLAVDVAFIIQQLGIDAAQELYKETAPADESNESL